MRRSQVETHRAVWDLRDQNVRGDDLVHALREAIGGLAPQIGPAVEIHADGEPRPLPPPTENHLVRIASEAVTNARKHAEAGKIDVAVQNGFDGRLHEVVRPCPHSDDIGAELLKVLMIMLSQCGLRFHSI